MDWDRGSSWWDTQGLEAAALGLGGVAFSLAARDTIADAIAGFVILVDQPFRSRL